MIIKKELIKREIAGDTVLVPIGKTVYDTNGLFILNELASFIWDMLPSVESEEEICKMVLEEYDVAPDVVKQDIEVFLNTLRQMNIL